jgi:hypothetical protein
MDALLDIIEPGDLIDMFWKKTDVAMRYLMMIFPDAEKGKFLVNAVSSLIPLGGSETIPLHSLWKGVAENLS